MSSRQSLSIPCPLLILHGNADHVSDWKTSQEFFNRLEAPSKEYIIIEGGCHTRTESFCCPLTLQFMVILFAMNFANLLYLGLPVLKKVPPADLYPLLKVIAQESDAPKQTELCWHHRTRTRWDPALKNSTRKTLLKLNILCHLIMRRFLMRLFP